VLGRALERFGLTVTQVGDGEAAVEQVLAAPGRFRLVLLDLTMPRLNGDEALLRIREVAPDLPALMLSGFLEEEIRDRVAGAQRVGLLQKPFSMRVLADVLWQVLGPDAA
jgi:CheY-like chemotaxis protein